MSSPLPFSSRLTAVAAVFACIQVAAPPSILGPTPPTYSSVSQLSAQSLTTDPLKLAALNLIYSQLNVQYMLFLPGPQILTINPALVAVPPLAESLSADPNAMFNANVAAAIASVTALKTILNGLSAVGSDAVTRLQTMQSMVSNALTNLVNVQTNEV
jgi:hypothetical protein